MQTTDVVVGIMTLELHFEHAHSLKEKRMVLNRLKSKLKHRSGVAVAEVDHQDKWQRTGLAVVAVGGSGGRLERLLDDVRDEVESMGDGLILREERELR